MTDLITNTFGTGLGVMAFRHKAVPDLGRCPQERLTGARVFRCSISCIDLQFGMCDTSVYLPQRLSPKKLLRS